MIYKYCNIYIIIYLVKVINAACFNLPHLARRLIFCILVFKIIYVKLKIEHVFIFILQMCSYEGVRLFFIYLKVSVINFLKYLNI